jgi:hypothetical protein
MSTIYSPTVNDYVKWKDHEGWVYFKCSSYITIELGTTPKSDVQLVDGTHHRKNHILLVCHSQYWNELECVGKRDSMIDTYKSQEHRYSDPQ